jgi:hypothetical protein
MTVAPKNSRSSTLTDINKRALNDDMTVAD